MRALSTYPDVAEVGLVIREQASLAGVLARSARC